MPNWYCKWVCPSLALHKKEIYLFLSLKKKVLDADKSCDISGELKISLDDMDLSKSNEIWGDIVKVKRQAIDRPELLVSLNYLPQAARLTVNVIRAKNLENEDLFVKVNHKFYDGNEQSFLLLSFFPFAGLPNSKWKTREKEKDRNLEKSIQRAHLERGVYL